MSSRTRSLAIRHEDKSIWERRVPLTPDHVKNLIAQGIEVSVQRSPTRIFKDEAYAQAGATLVDRVDGFSLVIGVKEIPEAQMRDGVSYLYFSHVIKGQDYNMPRLQTLLDKGCDLLDYEKITDAKGRRLVFFGRYAGLAGAIDTLWTLGQGLAAQGVATPLAEVKRAHAYADLAEAMTHIGELGQRMDAQGIPQSLQPLVFGVTGYGNVSQGAQEILNCLPIETISPEDLLDDKLPGDASQRMYMVVFKEQHMVRPVDDKASFDLQDYFQNPAKYTGQFSRFHRKISVLINCIYWDTPYPRLLTRDEVKALYAEANPKLKAIGDISCDIEGSVEITLKATPVEEPSFVYLVDEDRAEMGVKGKGPLVMSVDNLPCELPADASQAFGDALLPYIPGLVDADFTQALDKSGLPEALQRAVIVQRGALTESFHYLQKYLTANSK